MATEADSDKLGSQERDGNAPPVNRRDANEYTFAKDDAAATDEAVMEASKAPLLSHLVELRARLLRCLAAITVASAVCFAFSQQLLNSIVVPFEHAVNAVQTVPAELHYRPLELFFARVKVALIGGVMLAFPALAHEFYKFVAPGLYQTEKRAVFPFLLSIPLLFGAGMALVYFLIMPFVIDFAISMQQPAQEGREVAYTLFVFVGDYLSLMMALMVAFGFAFQLPVILTLLALAGLLDDKTLVKNRRFAIVGIFLVAAFMTPPDPISQIALGISICALYEVSILAVRFAKRRNATISALDDGVPGKSI